MKITVRSAAKINLTLDITGRRPDGYHDLLSVMQSVGVYEYVTIENNDSGKVTLSCDKPDVPTDGRNIAVKCANAFYDAAGISPGGLHISVQKNIPMQAGLAGGSADGAAVLFGLNELYGRPLSDDSLLKAGASVGADIPFCLSGGTLLAEGIGEILTPLTPMPDCAIVIVKPEIGVSTAAAYSACDQRGFDHERFTERYLEYPSDLRHIARCLHNDFEQALGIPGIAQLTKELREFSGCLDACMSGSGSAVFAIFEDEKSALLCAGSMSGKYPFAECTKPVLRGTEAV